MLEITYTIFAFIYGAVIGSFLNVVVLRRDSTLKFYEGRSECGVCHNKLTLLDLIPILSFIFSRGRCRHCGKHYSYKYAVAEFTSGLIFMLTYLRFGFSLDVIFAYIAVLSFVLLAISDLHTFEIRYKYFIVPLVFLLGIDIYQGLGSYINYLDMLIMFVIMYILFQFMHAKMGGADVLMLSYLAGIYSLSVLPYIMLGACLFSLLVLLYVSIRKGKELLTKTPIPFIYALLIGIILYESYSYFIL